jgi:hypothetical protein
MSIIRRESILYKITNGSNKGRTCAILVYEEGSTKPEDVKLVGGFATVAFMDDSNKAVQEKFTNLSPIEIPGWHHTTTRATYGYKEYLQRMGNGDNLLRTLGIAQPRTIKEGDILATGERVVSQIRLGFNSSVLIELAENGWVEMPSRIPIALKVGNGQIPMDKKLARTSCFSLPLLLRKREVLVVGDGVLADPHDCKDGWVELTLTGGKNGVVIAVPICIPVATLPWFAIRDVHTFKLWRMAKKRYCS